MPSWVGTLISWIPEIFKKLFPNKKVKPNSIDITDSVWDKRNKKTDN